MSDYAVFIISHKRPEVKTLETLKDLGYTGDYFIVIDDHDPTIAEYQEKYGEHVLIFSKEELIKDEDTIDNFNVLTSCLHPRNYCIQAAKEKGYKYLIDMDDDVNNIAIRYENDGKLLTKKIENITDVFDKYIHFLEISKFNCLGFILSPKLIGGASNKIVQEKVFFCPHNVFIQRADADYFTGTIPEDMLYSVRENNIGKLTLALMPVTISTGEYLNSKGGLEEVYASRNAYAEYFRIKIVNPSAITIKVGTDGAVNVQMHTQNFIPKILSEEYKKK